MATATASPPLLDLTKEDEHELRMLVTDLEAEVLTAYETYLYGNNRVVNAARWKPIRSKDDMHVYRERKAFKHNVTSESGEWSGTSSSSMGRRPPPRTSAAFTSSYGSDDSQQPRRSALPTTFEIGPMHAMAASSNMPVIMVTGSAPGSLDDALYGISISDTPSVRRRSLYQKEKLEDCAVLATMDTATYEDPFLFRGIVWFLKDYPVINTIVKPRDLLLLCSIRQATTSRGERIGLVVYHSISHSDVPEFRASSSTIRVQNSLSVVFRQLDDHRIEIYMTNFVDPMGKVPEMFITKDVAQALITSANLPNSGLKKKLHWLMCSRQRRHRSQSSMTDQSSNNRDDTLRDCVSCRKTLGRVFSGSGAACQLCYQLACSKCRVAKKIAIESTATSIAFRPFEFCIGCMMAARGTSAMEIARAELGLQRDEGSVRVHLFGY